MHNVRGRPKKHRAAQKTSTKNQNTTCLPIQEAEKEENQQILPWNEQPQPDLDLYAPPLPERMLRQNMAAKFLSSAILWHSAYMDLDSLSNKSWIESTVADFYLASIWHDSHGSASCRFVMIFRDSHNLQLTPEMVEKYRHAHDVPLNTPCPVVPVTFLVHDPEAAHFFAVVFDYAAQTAYVFGRKISNGNPLYNADWHTWRGPERWQIIADLHHWDARNPEDTLVLMRDWPQNGYDCGPIACTLIQKCMEQGLEETWNSLLAVPNGASPPIPCGHILRLNILGAVQQRCMTSFQDYMHFLINRPHDWDYMELGDEAIQEMQSGGDHTRDNQLLRSLTLASNSCRDCRIFITQAAAVHDKELGKERGRDQEDQENWEPEEELQQTTPNNVKALFSLIKSHRILDGTHLHRSLRPSRAAGPLSRLPRHNAELNLEEDNENSDQGQLSNSAKASCKQVKDWRLGTLQRFPRISQPPPLNAYKGQRFLPHDPDYDNYDDGPTLEMLQQPEVYSIHMYPFQRMIQTPALIMWRDHGYRILTDSFQMFYLAEPIQIMDHIMTIGNIMGHGRASCNNSSHPKVNSKIVCYIWLYLQSQAEIVNIQKNDDTNNHSSTATIMSASQMLECAGPSCRINQACTEGHNMFIRGRLPVFGEGETYVHLDLEQDKVDFAAENITISVDIDSIIWTTRKLICQNSIGVYMTPIYDSRPGIPKHNHVYVDILIPQSEEDQQASGGRTEWLSKKFPLNAIPHTTIGQLASSTGHVLKVYTFFPRMIHRSPITGRHMNMMPKEVLDPFWEKILLPAIGDRSTESYTPYMLQTLEEVRYKQRGAGRSQKTLPLSNEAFIEVQEAMKELIMEQDDHSIYGSFFFVVEGKGIKLLTKDGQEGVYISPEAALRENLSCLAWDHMLNRNNGELIVDIGVSFTPQTHDPVIGLWRLDTLEESYAAAGFNRGTIHHHCMLYNYGALQAEMHQDRALQTHVAFRNTYNLYYEAVRPTNNMPSFAKDSDAYSLNSSYHKECSSIVKIFQKVRNKTYGVRDEYRVSGQAIQVLLREIIPQAKKYMESKPVLWLPSTVWFDFLSRRVEEIQRTQVQLKNQNPPNLGIMTGILNHMLRCIVSTPIIYDFHVRESLALMKYRNIVKKAGMFFLQELELDFIPCLDSIQETDDFRVLALMGVHSKAQRDRAVISQHHTNLDGIDQVATFPIGPNPTWSQLKKAIAANPVLLLKEWTMPAELQNIAVVVSRLFCKFTEQIWMMVDRTALKGIEPTPTSLPDAMRCWTAASIDQTILQTTFNACTTGLENQHATHGRRGPQSMSFAQCMEIYFPSREISHPPRQDSQWSIFWSNMGYITAYHKMLEDQTSEEEFYFQNTLEMIFSHLQCLPASQKITEKSKGFIWRIRQGSFVFNTNPRFYKIKGLSKESKKSSRPQTRQFVAHHLKSKKVFEESLWRLSGFHGATGKQIETNRQLRQARLKRLSTATKNKRKPPRQPRITSRIKMLPALTPDDQDEFISPLAQVIGISPATPDISSESEMQEEEEEEEEYEDDFEHGYFNGNNNNNTMDVDY
ncbi:hypothetical protein J3R83DRAFT_10148 [Lanmaoa asiatica]|nr:hypothetical protein J3R83DRAFT_10148 [Lanmaoa asiatica]